MEWSEAFPWRPFCSRRCRDQDFIAWAREEHALPGDAETADLFSEDPPPPPRRLS